MTLKTFETLFVLLNNSETKDLFYDRSNVIFYRDHLVVVPAILGKGRCIQSYMYNTILMNGLGEPKNKS